MQSASQLFLDDSSSTPEQTNVVPDTSDLESYLCDLNVHHLSQTDCCVAYLISGYIARSVSCCRKCDSCKALQTKNNDSDKLEKYLDNENIYLLKSTDCGGLAVPMDYSFALCSMAVQAYDNIISDEVLKQKLMKFSNQRFAFVQILSNIAKFSKVLSTTKYCSCGQMHVNCILILLTAFNCFAKNELKRLNQCHVDAPSKMSRSARKLTAKSSGNCKHA